MTMKGFWKGVANVGLGVAKYAVGHPELVEMALAGAGHPEIAAGVAAIDRARQADAAAKAPAAVAPVS